MVVFAQQNCGPKSVISWNLDEPDSSLWHIMPWCLSDNTKTISHTNGILRHTVQAISGFTKPLSRYVQEFVSFSSFTSLFLLHSAPRCPCENARGRLSRLKAQAVDVCYLLSLYSAPVSKPTAMPTSQNYKHGPKNANWQRSIFRTGRTLAAPAAVGIRQAPAVELCARTVKMWTGGPVWKEMHARNFQKLHGCRVKPVGESQRYKPLANKDHQNLQHHIMRWKTRVVGSYERSYGGSGGWKGCTWTECLRMWRTSSMQAKLKQNRRKKHWERYFTAQDEIQLSTIKI